MQEGAVVAETVGLRIPSYSDDPVKGDARRRLRHLVSPHVDSFDYFLELGLDSAVADLPPHEEQ